MHRNSTQRRVVRAARRCGLLALSGTLTGGLTLLTGLPVGTARADWVNWDAVAQCESGGNWHADTGNGFYGGLQFRPSTWREFGGRGSPAKASKAEQIAVANRVLDEQGPRAWPKCGPPNMGVPLLMSWVKDPLRELTAALQPPRP